MSAADLIQVGEGHFALQGPLDQASVPQLWRAHSERFKHGRISLDLAKVSRCDSAGLALLLDWLALAKRSGGDVHFLAAPEQMLALSRVADVDELLNMGLADQGDA